jgi:hypothetical protein
MVLCHVQFSIFFIYDLFVSEPKGSTEELEPVLKGYYDAILGKAPVKKGRGGAKQIVKNRLAKNSSQESAKAGAALLAVCRGKVLLSYIKCLYEFITFLNPHLICSIRYVLIWLYQLIIMLAADFISRYLKGLTSLMTMLELWYPFVLLQIKLICPEVFSIKPFSPTIM